MLWLGIEGFKWTYAVVGDLPQFYLRLVALGILVYLGLSLVPVAIKWLLVGRFKEESFPVWGIRYFRFWVVRTLIATAPAAQFPGGTIFNVYLRLLGAKIGRGAVIKSKAVPAAIDLFSVGDHGFISPDSILNGCKAIGNVMHLGPVKIGSNAFIGEASVVDIGTVMEDGAQLGHASSLQSGQRIPAGRRYHGSPAVETSADYCPVAPMRCTTLRRFTYTALQSIFFGLTIPLAMVIAVVGLFLRRPLSRRLRHRCHDTRHHHPRAGLDDACGFPPPSSSGRSCSGCSPSSFSRVSSARSLNRTAPMSCSAFTTSFFRIIQGISNARFYNVVFGDSSAVVHYLGWIGWNLNRIEQTGSNFGTNQKHEYPFLCEIGSGTMVSDGLAMINSHMSANAFRLSHTRIGDRNYLGNNIHYPPDGKTGVNVLLGTKVAIPIDGPVRENVGLLGSPAFEIPRVVDRDRDFNAHLDEGARRARLRSKNWHNFVTIVLYLLANLVVTFIGLYLGYLSLLAYPRYGIASLAVYGIVMTVVTVLFFAFTERATLLFGRLKPKTVSIYDKAFWQHERHWKFCETPIQRMFRGTPFKNVVSRLMGVRVGRRVFDDGAQFTERTLVEIGDYSTINAGVTIQAHSLEEGVFKSDKIRIGNGCTLGPNAFIHYGVNIEDNALIETNSFLMKGEAPAANSTWQGNPARSVRKTAPVAGASKVSQQKVSTEKRRAVAASV